MEAPFLIRLLASSVACSTKACSIIRNVMRSGLLDVVEKGTNDYQTRADREAQKCIVSSLEKNFPSLKIIGEEGKLNELASDLCLEFDANVLAQTCPQSLRDVSVKDTVIWVDPLDGTNEFTQGYLQHVTVLIGVAVKGRAVGGVICQPFHSASSNTDSSANKVVTTAERSAVIDLTKPRVIWGLEGLGLFGIDLKRPDSGPIFDKTMNANTIVTTRSHMSPEVANAIESCQAAQVLRAGGCGYKVIMLLEGLAHAYIYARAGLKKWDTCGPEGVLRAAGGSLVDLFGRDYSYVADAPHLNREGCVATLDASWTPLYVQRIPDDLRAALS